MDELVGEHAVWRFDGESIAIRYETKGWSRSPLLKTLGHLELPVGLVGSVDFRPSGGKRGKGWLMQLKLRERTDPYAAVGAMPDDKSQPFRLTGPARTELVAEYMADQIRFAADQHAAEPDPAAATALVPELPLHVQTAEGTATLDGTVLRLVWSGVQASSRKKKAQRREYDLADVSAFEWVRSDGWEWGFLRVVTLRGGEPDAKPAKDLRCLLADDGAEGYQALLMAATATAHLWARRPAEGAPGRAGGTAGWLGSARTAIAQISAGVPALGERSAEKAPTDTAWIYEQIERLGELHTKGLLTDEEFATKKAELLARI